MLANSTACSGFAVDDIAAAKQSHGETIGLIVSEEYDRLRVHLVGGTNIPVYPTPNHTPATFTILNFPVDTINATVDALVEHDEGIETDERGSMRTGGAPTA